MPRYDGLFSYSHSATRNTRAPQGALHSLERRWYKLWLFTLTILPQYTVAYDTRTPIRQFSNDLNDFDPVDFGVHDASRSG